MSNEESAGVRDAWRGPCLHTGMYSLHWGPGHEELLSYRCGGCGKTWRTSDAPEAEVKALKPWKEAVLDAGVVHWTLDETNADDPAKLIRDTVALVIQQAADPAISEMAAEVKALREERDELVNTPWEARWRVAKARAEAAERELAVLRPKLEAAHELASAVRGELHDSIIKLRLARYDALAATAAEPTEVKDA